MSDDSSTPEAKPAASRKTTGATKTVQAPKISKKTAVVGAAIGIGSAAIVAALLYANRGNGSNKS